MQKQRRMDKEKMFKSLIEMDFSKDCSIKKLIEVPYEVDDEDEEIALNNQGIIKVLKMYLSIN